MNCKGIEDCGKEYSLTGCLVRDERNTVFWLTSDANGRYKQRVNRGDIANFDSVPRAGKDRDLSMFQTKTGFAIDEIAKTLQPCSAQSLVCVKGRCRPSSEVTAKVEVEEGCLAQANGQAMLVNTKAKTFRMLTDNAAGAPLFYTTCRRDAPKIRDADNILTDYTEEEPIVRAWRQHYCQNAAPCSEADLPVTLTQRQKVLAARETNNVEAIASVCRTDPEICTLFSKGVTLEECSRDPEACAKVVTDPRNRCDYFPKGSGCLYRPPKVSDEPRMYPFAKYASLLEKYNSTLLVLGSLFALGAIAFALQKKKSSS